LPQTRRVLKRPIGWVDGVATDRVIHSAPFPKKHKLFRGGTRNVGAIPPTAGCMPPERRAGPVSIAVTNIGPGGRWQPLGQRA
jgi:hypothetical protein